MKFAYADPPYIGQAKKHYGNDPDCAEVDHGELIERLCSGYPDGWALSCSSPSLQTLLRICPSDTRIGAWVKPFCSFKPNVNPAYAWEPVLFCGGRKHLRENSTVRDWLSESISLQKGVHGAKPREFCYWIFDLLNIQIGDTLEDLFPGTGVVSECFSDYLAVDPIQQQPLFSRHEASL